MLLEDETLNRTIERTWPRPLALAWARTRAAAEPYELRVRLVAFGEILFRVLLSYGAADYLTSPRSRRKGKRRTNPEYLLQELAKKPGDSLLKDSGVQLVLAAAETTEGTFFPEFAAWITERGLEGKTRDEQLGWLVSLRNQAAHGARSPSAEVELQRADEYYALLSEVVRSMDWMARYRLVHVSEATATGDGIFDGRLDDLMGDASVAGIVKARWRGWLNQGAVYVVNPDGDGALLVSPLVCFEDPSGAGQPSVWLFRQVGSRTGEMKLVDDFRAEERFVELSVGDQPVHWTDWVERRAEHRRRVVVEDLLNTLAMPRSRLTFVSKTSTANARTVVSIPRSVSGPTAAARPVNRGLGIGWRLPALVLFALVVGLAFVLLARMDGAGDDAVTEHDEPPASDHGAAAAVALATQDAPSGGDDDHGQPDAPTTPSATGPVAPAADVVEPSVNGAEPSVNGGHPGNRVRAALPGWKQDVEPPSDIRNASATCVADEQCPISERCQTRRCVNIEESAQSFLAAHVERVRDRDPRQFDDYAETIAYWYNRSGKTREELRAQRGSGQGFEGRYENHNTVVLEATRERAIVQTDVTREYANNTCRALTRFFVLGATGTGLSIIGEMDGPDHNAYPLDAARPPSFHTTHCGAVFDFDDGLEWYVSAAQRANIGEVDSYATTTTTCCGVVSSGNDAWLWRVPTEVEAASLFDGTRGNPVAAELGSSPFWARAEGGLRLFGVSDYRLSPARGRVGTVLLVRWELDAD